jgi:succinate-acetate transporter protein
MRRIGAHHRGMARGKEMTALNAIPDDSVQPAARVEQAEPTEATVAGPLAGNPAVIGLPSFIVGSIALGLVLVGMVPAAAVGASLPIILAATAIGQLVAALWSASLGQNAVASVFAIFGGFWLSYAVLVLGLTHNWFGITATAPAATSTQELFLTSWLITIVMLTLATLRLPLAFTAIFALVDLALLLVLLGTANANTSLVKAGGYAVFLFALVGAYLYFGALSVATGGKPVPTGRPILHG